MKASLRIKVFRMNIIPIAVSVILFMMAGILQVRRFANIMEKTNLNQNAVILDTMSDSMREMATENFQKYVVSESKLLNGEFWTMRHDMEVLAEQVQMVLEHPSYTGMEVRPPSMEDAGKTTLQLLYADYCAAPDRGLQNRVRRIGGLGNMMLEMVEGGKSLLDCMVSLPGGATVMVDNAPEDKFLSDGRVRYFNAERRPWYVGAEVHEATFFTSVNTDSFTDENQIMVGVPVYIDGELAAVCGGSIGLEAVGKIIADAQFGEYTDSVLINENGNVLYSSRESGELGMENNNLKSLKESSNARLVTLVNEALKGDVGFSSLVVDGEDVYVAYAPVETVGWTQLLMISQEDMNRTAYVLMQKTDSVMEESLADVRVTERNTIFMTLMIGAVLLIVATFTSMFFADGLVRPIKKMTVRVSEMQGEDMVFRVDDVLLTGDEIELLARAFEDMSVKMNGYVDEIVHITAEKQRLDTELSVAADIQENMLPTQFPAFPDRREFDLYAVMDPAKEVGGDFYDFFLIDEDHLALVMADVSGKGVPAALFMVISKTLIKNVALSGMYSSPAQILSVVNNLLCEGNNDNMFVTAWLGILTISTGAVVSASAGHEYPAFYHKDTGFVLEKDPHGMVMGGLEGIRYRETHWEMKPGDLLFLYTDGVPEANNSTEELFGNDRMMAALENSWNTVVGMDTTGSINLHEFLRLVRKEIDDFVGDTPQFDDLTMLCLEYSGPDQGERGLLS